MPSVFLPHTVSCLISNYQTHNIPPSPTHGSHFPPSPASRAAAASDRLAHLESAAPAGLGEQPGRPRRRGAAGCRHRCGQLVWASDAAVRSRAPYGNCSILFGFWQSGQICSGRKFKCHLIGFILMLHFIFLGNGGPEVTTSNLHVTGTNSRCSFWD